MSLPEQIQAYSINLDTEIPSPKFTALDEKSVVAIFDFIKESDLLIDSDPLRNVKVWEQEQSSFDIYQGAENYIAHKRKYYVSADKKLCKK